MNRLQTLILVTLLSIFSSCSNNKTLLEIPVDVNAVTEMGISKVAEIDKQISPEFSPESIIGWIGNLFYDNGLLIVLDASFTDCKVLVFDENGKFIRRISKRGRGPGEYTHLQNIAYDSRDKMIYLVSQEVIQKFNIEGDFIGTIDMIENSHIKYLHMDESELFAISNQMPNNIGEKFVTLSYLHILSGNGEQIKSATIRSSTRDDSQFMVGPPLDYISRVDKHLFLYYPSQIPETIVRDTIFDITNHKLLPFCRLNFNYSSEQMVKNEKMFRLLNIWRSGDYLLSNYNYDGEKRLFGYNLKSEEVFNLKDGFADDYLNDGVADIRPLTNNRFYYLSTPKDNDGEINESANPTIVIGRFK